MRDAFGGVFMTNLFLVFIFIYVAFTAVSLNYAKAYRLKNALIDFIEEQEIVELRDLNGKHGELDAILANHSYVKNCEQGNRIFTPDKGISGYCYNGITIIYDRKQTIEGSNSEYRYYKVYTFADWDLGALNKILALGGRDENSETPVRGTWRIMGEAKVVAKIS